MHADFSEFSYGYAVTEELATKSKASVIGAPRFPSLYEEGKTGGYDVKIPFRGKPVFLQFKLSDYLERSNAKEHKSGLLSVPYYRMHLRPSRHSDQHQLLMDLEASGETVFYIAPEFHLPVELNENYLKKSIINNSAAFSPADIGPLPDQDDHYIVFEKWSTYAYRCSNEPFELQKVSLEGGLNHALSMRDLQDRELGKEGLELISERLFEILESKDIQLTDSERQRDILGIHQIVKTRSTVEAIGYMCRTFFNTELVIIPCESEK